MTILLVLPELAQYFEILRGSTVESSMKANIPGMGEAG